jgi:sarcosine oxidase, subunit delta
MSFLIECPNCGPRPSAEFVFGGALGEDRAPAMLDAITEDLYFSDNTAGEQLERWFHRFGCERWLVACRDTRTNDVSATWDGVDRR